VLLAASVAAPASAAGPKSDYDATGYASWYGDELRGRQTASGERFDPDGYSAAHRTLPMLSYLEVTALDSGRTILVRINDRGPYHGNRLVDLSHGAARKLGVVGHGARMVRVRRVNPTDQQRLALQKGQMVEVRTGETGGELATLRDRSKWTAPSLMRQILPPGGGPYFIRIATFSSKSRAEAMAENLRAQLFRVNGLYQVRVGPLADANKVNAALAPLAAKGYPDVQIVR
jgi:rare lipoprotein A